MNGAARGFKLRAATRDKLCWAVVGLMVVPAVWLNVSQPLGDAAMPPALSSYGSSQQVVSPPVGASIAIAGENR